MPKNKGAGGATAPVVGLATDISSTYASSIVSGRKKEKVGEVARWVWVRWQEVEGGPLRWLLFPLERPEASSSQGTPEQVGLRR